MDAGDFMNINLGAPYEVTIQNIIGRGYAGNRTEVIRQALLMYERMLEEEEARLVQAGVEAEMTEIKSGGVKTHNFEDIKKILR